MANNKDLKLKFPMLEDYGYTLSEAFEKGKAATREHYRVKLLMYKQQNDAISKKHLEEVEVARIQGKIELINELFNISALSHEKEKYESQLVMAEAKASDVKVPYVDWYKLGEPQMFD